MLAARTPNAVSCKSNVTRQRKYPSCVTLFWEWCFCRYQPGVREPNRLFPRITRVGRESPLTAGGTRVHFPRSNHHTRALLSSTVRSVLRYPKPPSRQTKFLAWCRRTKLLSRCPPRSHRLPNWYRLLGVKLPWLRIYALIPASNGAVLLADLRTYHLVLGTFLTCS